MMQNDCDDSIGEELFILIFSDSQSEFLWAQSPKL